MLPDMGLRHTAVAASLAEFKQGLKTAGQALADTVTACNTATKAAGVLKEHSARVPGSGGHNAPRDPGAGPGAPAP